MGRFIRKVGMIGGEVSPKAGGAQPRLKTMFTGKSFGDQQTLDGGAIVRERKGISGHVEEAGDGGLFVRKHFHRVYLLQVALPVLAHLEPAFVAGEEAKHVVPTEVLLDRIFPEKLVSISQVDEGVGTK